MNPSTFPLAWPAGKPRTPASSRKPGSFKSNEKPIGMEAAYERVQAELDRLGGKYGLLSSNVELTLSGRPRGDRRAPSDPAVCLYFSLDGKPFAMGCDAFDSVPQNIAAIAGHIEATRRIARYGVASASESLRAFEALPAPQSHWAVLGLLPGSGAEAINHMYRDKARKAHPDQGGSEADMARLNAARDAAIQEIGA